MAITTKESLVRTGFTVPHKRMSDMTGYGVAFEGYMKRAPRYLKITVQGGSGADIVIFAMLAWIALR